MTVLHIVVAMKPVEGNYAENAIEYGIAGLNVDESRVKYSETNKPIPQLAQGKTKVNSKKTMFDGQSMQKSNTVAVIGGSLNGRWPANVLYDGSEEVKAEFPESKPTWGKATRGKSSRIYGGGNGYTDATGEEIGFGDSGSASRFFKECKI